MTQFNELLPEDPSLGEMIRFLISLNNKMTEIYNQNKEYYDNLADEEAVKSHQRNF